MMMCQNPKAGDTSEVLKEQMTRDMIEAEIVKDEVGFHFKHGLGYNNEAHHDCLCPLAKTIGHSDITTLGFENKFSCWNMVKNKILIKLVEEYERTQERKGVFIMDHPIQEKKARSCGDIEEVFSGNNENNKEDKLVVEYEEQASKDNQVQPFGELLSSMYTENDNYV